MPVGIWSDSDAATGADDLWDETRVVSRDVSPEAFMEELCANAGGYRGFFWTLLLHYFGWWATIASLPAIFFDHHRCEVKATYFAWVLYTATVVGVLAIAVLLELTMVQRLGLLRPGELRTVWSERRWLVPLFGTLLWKLDGYTDVVFVFVAHDCGSTLWWASLATLVFGVVFGQLLFNACFACTDCDRELPPSFGFVLLDFKLVNTAVRHVLPFDPDASHLPVSKPITLRTTSNLISMEKIVIDVAQVSIQAMFLVNAELPHSFVMFSVLVGVFNSAWAISVFMRECLQDTWSLKNRGALQMSQTRSVLLPVDQLAANDHTTVLRGGATASQQPAEAAGHSAAQSVSTAGAHGSPAPTEIGNRHGGAADVERAAYAATSSSERGHAPVAWDRDIPDML